MKKNEAYYEQLTNLYVSNKCTPEEMKELFAWLKETEANKTLLKKIQEEFNASLSQSSEEESITTDLPALDRKILPIVKRHWFKYAAAASLLLFFTFGYIYLNNKNIEPEKQIATNKIPNTITPGGNQATLTLSNGKVIALDSSFSGNISLTEAVRANKEQGKIDFSKINLSAADNNILSTTIKTPAGGQFNIVLPDGSHVWLNAASSITFPLQFSGKERKVEMSGELYFEIEKNTAMPFRVTLPNKNEIEVTGTHFNVMAYANEEKLKTTLLEGSITMHSADKLIPLLPGQQIQTDATGENKILNSVNTQQVIAWKNGLFDFDNVTLPEIMRQIERWYKTNVLFNEGYNQGHYVGAIKRESSINEVLHMLELAGDVKFKISGQTIIVMKP